MHPKLSGEECDEFSSIVQLFDLTTGRWSPAEVP
jgi:hypothetical protein